MLVALRKSLILIQALAVSSKLQELQPMPSRERKSWIDSGHVPGLRDALDRLIEAYRPDRIYLFGSVARGDSGPDSDYDLLVVVPDDAEPERRDSKLAYRALWGSAAAADVIVWTKSRFERRAHVVCSLPATVLREGKVVYAA